MDSGTCGKNLTWTFDNGTLTISGSGAMEDYFIGKEAPWIDYTKSIRKVVIEHGVTTIGNYAFATCKNLKEIKISDSVTSIGKLIFLRCKKLKEIHYPARRGFEENLSWGNAKLISYNPSSVAKPTLQPVSKSTNPPAQIKQLPKPVVTQSSPPAPVKPTPQPVSKPEPQPAVEELQATVAKQVEQIREKLLPLWWEEHRRLFADKLRWKVEGKTLTVGGVSDIKAYSYEETPWRDSLNDIQRIIIENGVEEISARAFIECRRLELLTIPASVKTIGDMAFSFCYCGNGLANGGRNVYWTLENGVLNLKKNLTVRGDADFSTGAVTWLAIDKNIKNIKGIKLEAGVVPKEKFFEWLGRRSNALQIAFG